jgi:predicted N-acetyltransferase YhbS
VQTGDSRNGTFALKTATSASTIVRFEPQGQTMPSIRRYQHEQDFNRVGQFLIDVFEPGPDMRNWLQPRWEYMFAHPFIDNVDVASIGIAEEDGEIVGVVHPEDHNAFCHLQIEPGPDGVRELLLEWAESHFGGWSRSLEAEVLGLWIPRDDRALARLAARRGFTLETRFREFHAQRSLLDALPAAPLPDGYRIQSLADENDYEKINRVLWRGFDHEGEPPDAEIPGRIRAQQTPGFRRDLTIVAVAPSGEYASFAGMWIVPENRVGYVEPVATDPDHRRMGLGRAAVVETLRRVAAAGAVTACVGSDLPFYRSIGFEVTASTDFYVKSLR